MSWAVFLRAVNVGKTNRCQPVLIAKQLVRFGMTNIGAVGTFVVRKDVAESTLRDAIADRLPFRCDIMICPATEVTSLVAAEPFAGQPSDPDVVRFVSVMARKLPGFKPLPLIFPPTGDWSAKLMRIQGPFAIGLYRRHMKAIGYLGKIEKQLGVPVTTRNWNTIQKVAEVIAKG
ncbi:MAG TPA: DUF1697 domain-containing protein [Chthoniobacterales bacterium]|jgi:uncharacterized protein (DUF1697 family)